MNFPKEVIEVIDEIVAENLNDIPRALELAEGRIRDMDDYASLVSTLVTSAIRDLIYDARHKISTAIKRESGQYGERRRRVQLDSPAVTHVWESVYNYCINGTTLGELTGDQLDGIIKSEEAIAAGHRFNAELIKWLKDNGVTETRRVRDVIPERRLKTAFKRLHDQIQGNRG